MKNKGIKMPGKYYNFIYKHYRKRSEGIKGQEGFTLVEVMVALLVISIITVGLVQGTRVSVNTVKVNKEKTRAIAIANEKIELIKTLSYDDIKLQSEYPNWPDERTYPMLYESGYDIKYKVTEATDPDTGSSYKQLTISVFKPPMRVPVNVVTQIYPLEQGERDTTPPAAPTGLTAKAAGPFKIDLDWNDNTEDDIEGYKVYRDTVAGFTPSNDNFVIKVVTSEYTDISLTPSTKYYYRVKAVDTSGNESEPSLEASATTDAPDTTPPAKPTGLTATATGQTSIELNWNNNTEDDIEGYEIYRSTTGGFTPEDSNFIRKVNSNEYTDEEGLDAGTKYYYRIKAVDTSGNKSQPSDEASATTLTVYTEINLPFIFDGAGEYYWKTNQFSTVSAGNHYVNSWNLDLLEINGVDYTNTYKFQHEIPPSSDGWWYIHYKGSHSYSHVEIK
ncbi:MAG: fibronectin type III domain-containing protein [Actinomycetota bacterium]|nr:fibronectin type III domain-containing protein [Actinomycetota bacterium]